MNAVRRIAVAAATALAALALALAATPAEQPRSTVAQATSFAQSGGDTGWS